jgi:hypothetical protein
MHGREWIENEISMDPTGWWISEKFDGIRAFWDGRNLYSKNGKITRLMTGFLKFFVFWQIFTNFRKTFACARGIFEIFAQKCCARWRIMVRHPPSSFFPSFPPPFLSLPAFPSFFLLLSQPFSFPSVPPFPLSLLSLFSLLSLLSVLSSFPSFPSLPYFPSPSPSALLLPLSLLPNFQGRVLK